MLAVVHSIGVIASPIDLEDAPVDRGVEPHPVFVIVSHGDWAAGTDGGGSIAHLALSLDPVLLRCLDDLKVASWDLGGVELLHEGSHGGDIGIAYGSPILDDESLTGGISLEICFVPQAAVILWGLSIGRLVVVHLGSVESATGKTPGALVGSQLISEGGSSIFNISHQAIVEKLVVWSSCLIHL